MYYVYLLASYPNGTLHIGMTNNLVKRVWEHREGVVEGFTKKYHVHRPVYWERFGDVAAAIQREKQLKTWNRAWKLRLIEKDNPDWDDLYPTLI